MRMSEDRPVTGPCMRTHDTRTWKAELKSPMHFLWSKLWLGHHRKPSKVSLEKENFQSSANLEDDNESFYPCASLSSPWTGKNYSELIPHIFNQIMSPESQKTLSTLPFHPTLLQLHRHSLENVAARTWTSQVQKFQHLKKTNWNTKEPQTPSIAMPENCSRVAFSMLTPLMPSTSFDLNNDATMDYMGVDARENMENGGLCGLGDAFTSP